MRKSDKLRLLENLVSDMNAVKTVFDLSLREKRTLIEAEILIKQMYESVILPSSK